MTGKAGTGVVTGAGAGVNPTKLWPNPPVVVAAAVPVELPARGSKLSSPTLLLPAPAGAAATGAENKSPSWPPVVAGTGIEAGTGVASVVSRSPPKRSGTGTGAAGVSADEFLTLSLSLSLILMASLGPDDFFRSLLGYGVIP